MNDVKKKICGYAYLVEVNGVPVLCVVQSRDKREAVDMVLRSGRNDLDEGHFRPVTIIPGHRDDLFPNAKETELATLPLLLP